MNATGNKQEKTFSFRAPHARNVLLAGDFTHWLAQPIPLHKSEDGIWRATTSLAPGTYHYRFYVDNEWCEDPKCKTRVRNPFGTVNSVIQVFGRSRTRHNAVERTLTGTATTTQV
jgi:1,4-alpha-glucan branching enzyme